MKQVRRTPAELKTNSLTAHPIKSYILFVSQKIHQENADSAIAEPHNISPCFDKGFIVVKGVNDT